MDNKICTKCGQVNFPNANNCTKCGNALNAAENNPFSAGGDPPPTMMPGHFSATPPGAEKKSNKMFWIIGIVVVLLVSFVGLLGVIGIGSYIYYSSKKEVVYDYPKPKPEKDKTPKDDSNKDNNDKADPTDDDGSPLSDIKFPTTTGGDDGMKDNQSGGNAKVTDAQLLSFFLEKKSKVGSFTLKDVTTTDSKAKFPNRIAGVSAQYTSGSKKLTHNFAAYDSVGQLKDDFDEYMQEAKRSGGKITNTTATSVIYIKGSLVYFAFYNPQGGFHEMSSRVGKDILKYHNDYFGVK
jgi:hypothetical protein